MESSRPKSALDRFLNLFAEVKAGEGITVVLLALNLFLVLSAYYLAKVAREPLILVGGGAELKSYAAAGQVLLLAVAVRFYAGFASRVSRKRLINTVNIFFGACLVVFYILAVAEAAIGIIFFLWVGMFNVMVVAQFWSFANDVYTPEEGKRLFAIVAFGASSGAVLGAFIAGRLIPVFGVYQLLLASAGVLLLSLLITNIVDARERHRLPAELEQPSQPEQSLGKEGAFKLVFANRYLLMIACLILLLNWVNTTGEYILGAIVTKTAKAFTADATVQKDFIGKFYADFFFAVNLAGMLIQLFLVSRILKYFGIGVAIVILPLIALGGYLILAFYPLLAIVRWAKIAENSTDYSLNNTVRHALFLPTTREEKYKAKQAIDSFFHRAGDVLQAVLVFVGLHWLSFQTKHFALFNVMLVGIWLFLAIRIGKTNKELVEAPTQEEKATA